VHQPSTSLGRVRVLDLTDRWGQFAAKLLTQLGADVVMGERADGHDLRRAWPLAVSSRGEPISLYFWHFNVGKRSVLFEPGSEEGQRRAAALLMAADVVLVGEETYGDITVRFPEALQQTHIVAITAYGLGSPDRARDDDLHVASQSGMAGLSGYGSGAKSAPIIPPVEQTMHSAGLYGAIAALLAIRLPSDQGGQLFDVSAQAAAFQGTEQLFAHWVYRKEHLHRRAGGYATSFPTGRWQLTAVDGAYVYAFGLLPRTQREWHDLRAWMRREDAIQDLDDPLYDDLLQLRGINPFEISPEGQHAAAVITEFLESMEAERTYREAQAIKMGWARVFQPEDILGEEQFQVRKLFQATAWPGTEETFFTQSLPWILRSAPDSGDPGEVMYPPTIGEHTDQVTADWQQVI
jgi:crotonobetainyl-CoA:carnitine CoA-transferase CaiB-like acyl-CoA transferase